MFPTKARKLFAVLMLSSMAACGDAAVTAPESSRTSGNVQTQLGIRSANVEDVVVLPSVGGIFDVAMDVNAAGEVVGRGRVLGVDEHAFFWSEEAGLVDLTPSANEAWAEAINEDGHVAGWSEATPFSPTQAFRWTADSGLEILDNPDPRNGAFGRGVGPQGVVVGDAFFGSTEAARWPTPQTVEQVPTPASIFSSADGVNGSGTIVGSLLDDGFEAFLFSDAEGAVSLPGLGGGFTVAEAINEEGVVAGVSSAGGFGGFRAVVWDKQRELHVLPVPPGAAEAEAIDINGAGWVAGYAYGGSSGMRPMLWKPSEGDYEVFPLDTRGFATGISDAGHVVGSRDGRAVMWKVGADVLELSCTPNPIVRGETATCTASGGSSDLQIMEWRFEGGGHEATEERTSATWEGTMVVSGEVAVITRLEQQTDTTRSRVEVEPRNWEDLVPPIEEKLCGTQVPQLPECPLPRPPASKDQLGMAAPIPVNIEKPFRQRIVSVEAGPNAGWLYLEGRQGPLQFDRFQIWVNSILADPGDPFWNRRPGCRRNLRQVRNTVLVHERLHAELFTALLPSIPLNQKLEALKVFDESRRSRLESAVHDSTIVVRDSVTAMLDTAHVRASVEGIGSYPDSLPCNIVLP